MLMDVLTSFIIKLLDIKTLALSNDTFSIFLVLLLVIGPLYSSTCEMEGISFSSSVSVSVGSSSSIFYILLPSFLME